MTLNQIVKEITTIGNDHEQIKHVYFGDVWERLSNGEVTYPALFFTLTSAAFLAKQIQYNFSIYLMDRMLSEETNETEKEKEIEFESNHGSIPNRRRRRRSSALDTDGFGL
jgi:hypothetical protein